MEKPTFNEIIGEFDAGLFIDRAQEAMKMVALGVVNTGKKGKITLEFELDQVGDTSSVQIKHSIKYLKPNKNGKSTEEMSTHTPMYVDNLGYLTISPQTQEDLFKSDKSNNVQSLKLTK